MTGGIYGYLLATSGWQDYVIAVVGRELRNICYSVLYSMLQLCSILLISAVSLLVSKLMTILLTTELVI
jgi:hypothetical protein